MTPLFCQMILVISFSGITAFGCQDESPQTWDQFRGPRGDGYSQADNLPTNLSDPSSLAWRTGIPGRGWSSPLVLGNEIWITTAIETEATAEEREKMLESAPSAGLSAYSSVNLQAICLDRKSGEIKKTIDLFSIDNPPLIHSLNSFSSPTPVADDRFLYCHFGAFGTAAIRRETGEVVWKNQENVIDHETGPGSSPFLHNGMLILHCDGIDQQYVCALEIADGQQIWKTDRSGEMNPVGMYKKAFSTPIVIERGGRNELVSPAANWVYGYDPATGAELWRVPYGQLGFSNVARPVVHGNSLLVCSCFMNSVLMAIDISGDQPLDDSNVKWTYHGQVPNMPSPIVAGGNIYFTSDRGIITCVDGETGEKIWSGRLGRGYSSSPILADGNLYFGDQNGVLFVVEPSPEALNIVSENQLDSRIMASPAAVDQSLFVRTETSLYHFQK